MNASHEFHSPLTLLREWHDLTRTAAYPMERGSKTKDVERDSYVIRKRTLMVKLGQAE